MGAGAPTITGRTAWQVLRLPAAEYAFVHARGDGFESTDPATGELVAELAASSAADVDDAVGAAVAAGQSGWRSNGELRARVLYGFAQALRADADRLAELLTREQGKTIHEAHIEIAGSAKMTEYYAGLARLVYGRSAVLGPAGWSYLEKICDRLPSLGVIVCTGRSSVSRISPQPFRARSSFRNSPGGV